MAIKRSGRRQIIKRIRAGFSINKIFTALTSTVSRPSALILFVIALSLYISESGTTASDKTLIGQLVTKLNSTKLKEIGTYIGSHRKQFIGYIIHLGAIFAAVPAQNTILFALASGLFCFLLPEAKEFEYLVQAVLLILFFRLRDVTSRVVLVFAGFAAYISGYFLTHIK